ncbi:ankyrin repeat domain-containing protein [Wolbachia pipientis]|uniref:ankyrin repeat domain-containing protein n=1 Tax=Wolbachia pipientis TaxID=955 RepID=UPI0025A48986|nr:ankyrin repeat domain-containing protein [Wolbachia pipientis]MDM8334871.1 ankyrin repeat domain-containing protein [Wolbachia pipientis]
MKSILYFTLLFIMFGSLSLLAVEQVERKKTDADESISSVHDNVDIRKSLKQDAPESTAQRTKPESSKSDPMSVDKLNVKKTQDTKIEGATNKKEPQYDENKTPTDEKAIGGSEKGDKDLPNLGDNLPKESKDEVTPDLSSVTNKEMGKNLALPSSASLNESAVDLRKDLQINEKVDVEENKPLENNTDKLLEEKKEKVENQTGEGEVKGLAKDHNGKNQVKPITKEDEKSKQEEKKDLQKWTKLNREQAKEWYHKDTQSKSIYKRQYDTLNEHLPTTIFINDYSTQLFYCIKKNNLVCLRGIISKLEKLGLTTQEVLKFRNKLGNTPLIYAVKRGEIDVVRFLLLQGADPKVVNNNLQSPIDIAIKRGRVDMINAIAEMTPYLLEYKRIDNKESLEMYDWAVKTKENNELQCSKD